MEMALIPASSYAFAIGDDTWLGPGTTVLNGISIGEKVFTGIGTNVIHDTDNDVLIYGNPGKTNERKVK